MRLHTRSALRRDVRNSPCSQPGGRPSLRRPGLERDHADHSRGAAHIPQARFAAITQMAVFEAVNAITHDYKPCFGTITAPAGALAYALPYEGVQIHVFSDRMLTTASAFAETSADDVRLTVRLMDCVNLPAGTRSEIAITE